MLEEIKTILHARPTPGRIALPAQFDTPDLRAWLASVGAADIEIEWSAESLVLYGTESLLDRQTGYAGAPGHRHEEWPAAWLVIGDVHADPIVLDMAATPPDVWFGRHGLGAWNLQPLASSLDALDAALAVWCRMYYLEYDKRILDADYEVLESFKKDLEAALRDVLQPHELTTFLFAVTG